MPDTANFYLPNINETVCSVTNNDYPSVTCPASSSGIAKLTVDSDLFTDDHTGNYLCCTPDTNCVSPFIAIIYGEYNYKA